MHLSKRTAKRLVEIHKKHNVRPSVVAEIRRLILDEVKEQYYKTANDIDQTLGVALGYPYYASDQHNFPGTTEEHGVCTGDNVPESLADEAAHLLERMAISSMRVLQYIAVQSLHRGYLSPKIIRSFIEEGLGEYNGPSPRPSGSTR